MNQTSNMVTIDICDENDNLFTTVELPEELLARLEEKTGGVLNEGFSQALRAFIEKAVDRMAAEIKKSNRL